MSRPELSHRYKRQKIQIGDGILSNIASKVVSVVASDVGKKLITKTVDSLIDYGAKKAGEFVVEKLTKRPGELIREHLATARKPPLNEDEKYLQDVIDKILKI
jgi:hypothetical protein